MKFSEKKERRTSVTCKSGVVCLLLCISMCYAFLLKRCRFGQELEQQFLGLIGPRHHHQQPPSSIIHEYIILSSSSNQQRERSKKRSFYSREQQVVIGEKSWGFSLGNSSVHHSLFSGIITVCNW